MGIWFLNLELAQFTCLGIIELNLRIWPNSSPIPMLLKIVHYEMTAIALSFQFQLLQKPYFSSVTFSASIFCVLSRSLIVIGVHCSQVRRDWFSGIFFFHLFSCNCHCFYNYDRVRVIWEIVYSLQLERLINNWCSRCCCFNKLIVYGIFVISHCFNKRSLRRSSALVSRSRCKSLMAAEDAIVVPASHTFN